MAKTSQLPSTHRSHLSRTCCDLCKQPPINGGFCSRSPDCPYGPRVSNYAGTYGGYLPDPAPKLPWHVRLWRALSGDGQHG